MQVTLFLSAHIVLNNGLSKRCANSDWILLIFVTEVYCRLKPIPDTVCVGRNQTFYLTQVLPTVKLCQTSCSFPLSVTAVSSLVCCSVLLVVLLAHLGLSEKIATCPSTIPCQPQPSRLLSRDTDKCPLYNKVCLTEFDLKIKGILFHFYLLFGLCRGVGNAYLYYIRLDFGKKAHNTNTIGISSNSVMWLTVTNHQAINFSKILNKKQAATALRFFIQRFHQRYVNLSSAD